MTTVHRFPVYQIDFSAVQAGKRVASSKRRIRWRFGFPNRAALEAKKTGIDCRGEEHEIVVVWSIASGKRQILMDGREVHYSSTRVSLLDHSWSTKGNHVLKILCYAAPPMTVPPGFRQYDFLIDGQSFFTMPKVYELGIKGTGERVPGVVRSTDDYNGQYNTSAIEYHGGGYGGGAPVAPVGTGYGAPVAIDPSMRAPRTPSEEEEDLRRAINASLEESKRHLGESATTAPSQQPPPPSAQQASQSEDLIAGPSPSTSDLLDFDGRNALPALMPDPMLSSSMYGGGAPPPSSLGGYDHYGTPSQQQFQQAPPQQQQYYQQPSTPSQYNQYGAPPTDTYGAPPPQQNQRQSFLTLPPTTQTSPGPAQQSYAGNSYGAPSVPPVPPVTTSFSSPGYNNTAGAVGYNSGLTVDPFSGHRMDDPFAPKPPSHNDIANDILKAYSTPTGSAANNGFGGANMGMSQYQPGQLYNTPQNNGHGGNQDGEDENENGVNAVKLSMSGLALVDQSKNQAKSALEQAMSKLVNLDHIDEPAEEQLSLTLKQKEDEAKKKMEKKSKPLPPAAKGLVGSAATLAQIQDVKPKIAKETVMKPPPGLFSGDPAMAGALVVHGAPPPPLQPRGVGIVHMQGQYPVAGSNMTMYNSSMQQNQQGFMTQQQQPSPMMYQQPQQQPTPMMAGYGQPSPHSMQYQQQQTGWR